jgi:hypothetical protein
MSLQTLAATLASLEGNGTTDINGRANNPLNVEAGNVGYGTITTSNGGQVTVYPSKAAGQAAGLSYLQSALASVGSTGPYQNVQTFGDFLAVWAGSPDSGYISQAAASIGATPSTPIGQVQAALGIGGGGALAGPTSDLGGMGGAQGPPDVPAAQGAIEDGGSGGVLASLGANFTGDVNWGLVVIAGVAALVVWLLMD